jgi:transcriptional regulator with XRE-family HTH domain
MRLLSTLRAMLTNQMVADNNKDMNPDPIYKDIGAIIRARRKALKLTQDKLSKKLRISRGALANIETGRQNILVHQLYNYATELGLTVNDLLPVGRRDTRSGEIEKVPVPSNVNRSQAEQIARLMQDTTTDTIQPEEVGRAKSARR